MHRGHWPADLAASLVGSNSGGGGVAVDKIGSQWRQWERGREQGVGAMIQDICCIAKKIVSLEKFRFSSLDNPNRSESMN